MSRKRKNGRRPWQCSLERAVTGLVIITGISIVYVNFILVQLEDKHPSDNRQVSSVGSVANKVNVLFSPSKSEVYHGHIDDNNNIVGNSQQQKNIQPILEILRHANFTLNDIESSTQRQDLISKLPDWELIQERFGTETKIIGLDRCSSYNAQISKSKYALSPAGPFNSGTNFLHDMLQKNCQIPVPSGRKKHTSMTGVTWQVPWGKHQSPRFRTSHSTEHKGRKGSNNNNNTYPENINVLPVVMVRDPLLWFQSMCKVRYAAHWYHIVPDHCPNFIPNHVERDWYYKTKQQLKQHYNNDPWKVDNVSEKANFTLQTKIIPLWVRYHSEIRNHKSLAHMWLDWYEEYYNVDYPRLMVRIEDLVFYPKQTIRQICECIDGATYVGDDNFSLSLDSTKQNSDHIHGKDRTGLIDAIIKHATQNRTYGMTQDDLNFVRAALKDSIIRQEFGYKLP